MEGRKEVSIACMSDHHCITPVKLLADRLNTQQTTKAIALLKIAFLP